MKVLFVSPHPDDVAVCCGGTLAKHQLAGDEIHILIASECTDLERNAGIVAETDRWIDYVSPDSCDRLGLDNRYLPFHSTDIREAMESIRAEVKPDLIYTTWDGDINQDHRAVAEETIRVFRYSSILMYYLPHSCPKFAADYYVKIEPTMALMKHEGIRMFKSQALVGYTSAEYTNDTLSSNGNESGVYMAEKFKVWRLIR